MRPCIKGNACVKARVGGRPRPTSVAGYEEPSKDDDYVVAHDFAVKHAADVAEDPSLKDASDDVGWVVRVDPGFLLSTPHLLSGTFSQ